MAQDACYPDLCRPMNSLTMLQQFWAIALQSFGEVRVEGTWS